MQVIAQIRLRILQYNIKAIPASQLPVVYAAHHLFVLPTYGENFGHVIFRVYYRWQTGFDQRSDSLAAVN